MALVNNSSFIPTANDFLAHWADVDAAIGSSFVLPGIPGVIPPGLKARANVRAAGEDVKAGTTLLSAGHLLRPQDLGVDA